MNERIQRVPNVQNIISGIYLTIGFGLWTMPLAEANSAGPLPHEIISGEMPSKEMTVAARCFMVLPFLMA